MMNIPYNIDVYDNLVSSTVHGKVWEYVQKIQFFGVWEAMPEVDFEYTLSSPKNPNDWMIHQSMGRTPRLHRAPLGSDEASLKANHLPIYLLWSELNRKLNNQYELTGTPEGMYSPFDPPVPVDTGLKSGWRAYVNAHYNSHSAHGGQGYVHRDTPLEYNDGKTVTMLYIANTEWYPSWNGELKYYPEDFNGEAGDRQQFNKGIEQQRGYQIGWLDQGRVVSPVPGRLVVYDGRCLHSTTLPSAALETPIIKIAFRARLK